MERKDLDLALEEASEMVALITGADPEGEARDLIAKHTVEDYDAHYTPGLVRYRKSVTESGDYAAVEWTGHGSVVRDLHGREWIDCLGGYGIYNLGIQIGRAHV